MSTKLDRDSTLEPKVGSWPIRPYPSDRAEIEHWYQASSVSRSAILRGLIHLGLQVAKADKQALFSCIVCPRGAGNE